MREAIVTTITNLFNETDKKKLLGFKLNENNLISDFIFICYFLGNDFLPHIPSLDIYNNGIDMLINNYTKVMTDILKT
jgi:5'-3' exoribonuclease 2